MFDHGPSLLEASAWIERLCGQIVVIKVGGEMLATQAVMNRLARQIPVLVRVGLKPIIVHGAGVQVDAECRSRGIEIVKHGGRRVTTPETLIALTSVLSQLNSKLIDRLKGEGVAAFGMDESVETAILCTKRPPTEVEGETVNWGLVGDVQQVDPAKIIKQGPDWSIPVLPSLGVDSENTFLNVNADTAAARIAQAVEASKLLFLTGAPGVMGSIDDAGPISRITAPAARSLIDKGVAKAGMRAKLEECLKSIDAGIPMVHILSGKEPLTLLRELFTDEGCGTMISADES
jgi:acetylglutamate kinase